MPQLRGNEPILGLNIGSMMHEHFQRQASVGQAPTHFGHMMNCLKNFEDGCTKHKFNS
jgi:hypothetical protein